MLWLPRFRSTYVYGREPIKGPSDKLCCSQPSGTAHGAHPPMPNLTVTQREFGMAIYPQTPHRLDSPKQSFIIHYLTVQALIQKARRCYNSQRTRSTGFEGPEYRTQASHGCRGLAVFQKVARLVQLLTTSQPCHTLATASEAQASIQA
jgi:hypothetical protein